jgi:hypothetical protein
MRHGMSSSPGSRGCLPAPDGPGVPGHHRLTKKPGIRAVNPAREGIWTWYAPREACARATRASVKLTSSHVRNLVTGWYVVRRLSVFHHRRAPPSFPDWEVSTSQFRKLDHAEPV